VIRESASGEMKERLLLPSHQIGFDLGKEFARRMGVPFEPVAYESSGALIDNAKSGEWDVTVLTVSPSRAKEMDFVGPLVEVEYGFLIPSGSSISTLADVDRPGIRVGVQEKGTADSNVSRALKNAEVIRGRGLTAGLQMVKSGKADLVAANKTSLFEMSDQLPGSRVLDGRFATEEVAMAIPKGREFGMAYARKFVEDAKSGRVWSPPRSTGLGYAARLSPHANDSLSNHWVETDSDAAHQTLGGRQPHL
jgi:polar amino acid transport system substrate-binding protein